MIGFWLALGLASGSRAGARNPRGADGDPSAGTTLASAAPEVRMRWFPPGASVFFCR